MAITVGSVAVDVVPDASRFWSEFKAKAAPGATDAGDEIGRIIAERIQAQINDVRVKVNLDDGAARAEAAAFQGRMDELAAKSPDVRVNVEAAAAAAELAAVQAEADHLDGKDINLDVNDRGSIAGAEAGLGAVASAGIALGPAIIPVAAAAAAAVAGIGAAGIAAVGGLGVLALAFSGISGAVKELTTAHTNAGAAAAKSAGQQVSAAASIANAEQAVKDAHRGVADAERQATQSVQAALQQQKAAELSLADAQRNARQAQLDLNAARVQAKQDMEDLTLQVQDGALSLKQANLDVEVARENLNKVLTDPTTTATQRQQAQLTYDEAVQQVTDLTVRQQRLVDQQKAASKAGVDGSKLVQTAQDRLKAAQEAVAKARQQVANAEKAVVAARQAGDERILVAQERVLSAERALAVAHATAGTAAVAAAAKQMTAYDALTAAGKRFAQFVAGTLVPLFHQIQGAAQAGLLPGIEAGIRALMPLMPAFTAFIGALAQTMGTLFEQGAKALQAPFWRQFFGFLASTVGPNLTIMFKIFEGFAKGFAGLFEAFAPVAQQIGLGLLHMAQGFAAFGTHAGKSKGVQDFIAYLLKWGPRVMETIGNIFGAIGHILVALAPLGGVALQFVNGLAKIIGAVPVPVLTAIATAIVAVVVAMSAWSAAVAIAEGLFTAFGIAVAVLTSPITLVIAAAAALAFGIIELQRHWHTVWHAIATFFVSVYNVSIHPIFTGIMAAVHAVAGVFQWWNGVVTTVLTDIGHAAQGVWRDVTHWFDLIVGFFQKMPGRISKFTSGMWDGIKDAFRAVIDTIIGWWDKFVSYLKIPGFHISIPHTPIHFGFDGLDIGKGLQIPLLAQGGVATAATLGVFGEAGREAILPLDNPQTMKMLRDALVGPQAKPSLDFHPTIINPAPEPASRSQAKALRRTAFELGYAL